MTRFAPMLDEDRSPPRWSDEEAGFGLLETARGGLPLMAMDVTGRIDGLLAQTTIRQTFVNCTDEALEATYIFPLPDRAAVTGFRMEVAGRVVEGVLQERAQARRNYDQAIRQGHRASIAEEERPGVFTMRVGNLIPGDVATIQLTLVGVLPYNDGEVTFRFPMVVAPRYIPGLPLSGPSVGEGTAVDTRDVPDASRITPPVLLPGFSNPVRLSLAIDLYETSACTAEPRVSLHSVWEQINEGMRRIILRPGERLDRDFILRFRLGGPEVRTSLSLHPDAEGREGTFALTVVPPAGSGTAGAKRSNPRDVVFVLDRSGSMGGWKMVAARRATARMIDTLGELDRFTVFAFDDKIETPRWDRSKALDRLLPATDRNRFRAVEYLASLESRGGTEIAKPLERAVKLLADDLPHRDKILVLVTDGQVGNEDQVLKKVGARLRHLRVFTLGIDRAVNEGFLRRLAGQGQGGGSCELVESEDRLDAVMESIHRRIDRPVLTDVRFARLPDEFELVVDSMVPDRAPSLFAGSPVLLLGRYRGRLNGPVEFAADTPEGKTWCESIAACVRENPAIASAWARGQVRQLEDRYAAGHGNCAALEKAIVATSLRFGVLCRFTAYVAIDRREVVNEGGEDHQIIQPVEMPAGWDDNVVIGGKPRCLSAAPPPSACMAYETTAWSGAGGARAGGGGGAGRISNADRAGDSVQYRRSSRFHPREILKADARGPVSGPPPTLDELLRQAGLTLMDEIVKDNDGTVYRAPGPNGEIVSVLVLKNPVTLAGRDKIAKLEKQLTGLRHPGIVPILKLIYDSQSCIVYAVVSEYIPGRPLRDWISQHGLPDSQTAARLVLNLAEALEYAGRPLMVHGNLTPAIILIGDDGSPRITGFGLRSLGCGAERANSSRGRVSPAPTGAIDFDNLGNILFEVLTGVPPDLKQDKAGRLSPRAIKPQIPAELESICLRSMGKLASDDTPTVRQRLIDATLGSKFDLVAELRQFLGIKPPGDFWK